MAWCRDHAALKYAKGTRWVPFVIGAVPAVEKSVEGHQRLRSSGMDSAPSRTATSTGLALPRSGCTSNGTSTRNALDSRLVGTRLRHTSLGARTRRQTRMLG